MTCLNIMNIRTMIIVVGVLLIIINYYYEVLDAKLYGVFLFFIFCILYKKAFILCLVVDSKPWGFYRHFIVPIYAVFRRFAFFFHFCFCYQEGNPHSLSKSSVRF